MKQKRVLTIQDYSCLGRCSLTVALPILSAFGQECVGLPTAVLSNHTAYASWTYTDLSKDMLPSVEKWLPYEHHFDLILTGYLGNGQSKIVEDICQKLQSKDTVLMVDPAFADNDKLYSGFDENHTAEMRELVKKASLIVPNVTEACALLGKEFPGDELTKDQITDILHSLAALGPKKVVLTGVTLAHGKRVGEAIYDAEENEIDLYYTPCYPGRYHGAGDVFAACLAGAYVRGLPFVEAVELAHDYVHRSMHYTIQDKEDGILYGLEFERAIPYLLKRLEK
ncbi:MAG: pyridoxamine kinase [Eubacteriales bacterium]|nr:pyridoxamine kinase [Eubacteriales bacterium]